MIKRSLFCLLLGVILVAPLAPIHAQKSAPPFSALAAIVFPGDDAGAGPFGVYVGHGLVLTNWHRWTLDGQHYVDETSPLSPSRQIPHYDDDGQQDPDEVMAGLADCAGIWTPLERAGPACAPFVRLAGAAFTFPLARQDGDRPVPVERLVFASRAHDIALWEVDRSQVEARGVEPARLRAASLAVGETVVAAFVLPGEAAGTLAVSVATGTPALLPEAETIRPDGPWRVPSLVLAEALPEGAPVLDRTGGDVVGLAWRVAGSKTTPQTWVTPTSEWIHLLFAAAEAIQNDALDRVLAAAYVAPVDAPPTLYDPLAPSLGNSGIDVQHYALDLNFDLAEQRLSGMATLTVRAAAEQLATFGLDAHQLEVAQITIDGAPASFVAKEHKLIVELPAPVPYRTEFEVVVRYDAQPQPFASRFIPFFDIGMVFDSEHVSALNQPDGAHTWFPCNDHPRDRATYDFHLTAPAPLTAVANGELIDVRPAGGDARTFHWRMDAPMSTYLVTIAIADYATIDSQTDSGIALVHYVYPDSVEAASRVFSTTGDALELLAELFGPYPYASYGHVVVPRAGMALETQTMTTLPDSVLTATETLVYPLIVHELAHQWFGNAVALGGWADIWLNEGFASYAEWLARAARYGDQSALAARSLAERSLSGDNRVSPLAAPQPHEMFSLASYDKGAWVLHMLRGEIGDPAFFTLLRAYADTFRDRPTDTLAFWRMAEEVSGQELGWFFEQWLLQGGLPRFTLFWSEHDQGAEVLLCASGDDAYRLRLPLAFRHGSDTAAEVLHVDGATTRASFEIGFAPASLLADPDQAVLAQIEVQPIDALPEACPIPPPD